MARQLRPRTSRPSYVVMAGLDDRDEETGAGPSSVHVEEDSGSDFALEVDKDTGGPVGEDSSSDEIPDDESSPAELSGDEVKASLLKSKAQPKTKTESHQGSTRSLGLSSAPKRQTYVLPTPSVHHRHRAVPLFLRSGRVERLVSPPELFKEPHTTLTNNITQSTKITDRVTKTWGYNVGSGGLWELIEDRGWFKEGAKDLETEKNRRPLVYRNICVPKDFTLLDAVAAAAYTPTDSITTDDGNLRPPPPVSCLFGPMKSQEKRVIAMFEAVKMSDFIADSSAHVFNPGAPVWGLDWCPIHIDERKARDFKQYLAVGPLSSSSYSPDIGVRVSRPANACIQIWSLGSSSRETDNDRGEMKCEMVVCHDSGPAQELKWCPLPSHDMTSSEEERRPRKLGLLGGTFEDGTFSIFVIPDPADVTPVDHDPAHPVYIKIKEPILRIDLEDAMCWSFDWANSEVVAIGTTSGTIAVYNLGSALSSADSTERPVIEDLLPSHYITVHQSAIRALAWIRAPSYSPSGEPRLDSDPTVLATGGYDGMECLTDIREAHGSVMNRTRDVINTMAYSAFSGGPITIDHENIIKAYSASPSMLGRGHTLMEPQGPVWHVGVSDWHPQLAVASADGTCSTTNMLRSTRRGGLVPFFVHRIFQLDYSRSSKQYRMLEQFLPQETQDRTTFNKNSKSKKKKPEPQINTGAWSREVGVQRVVWNSVNGPNNAGLLVSATSSGLCRIDNLWGRWVRNKMPYGDVASIRDDDKNGMDVDFNDSDSS